MPKAKYKRKGTNLSSSYETLPRKVRKEGSAEPGTGTASASPASSPPSSSSSPRPGGRGTILDLPEELIRLILARLDISSVAALEATCKHLRRIIIDARIWRKIFLQKLEFEPGLESFLPSFACLDDMDHYAEADHLSYKKLLENLKHKIDYVWMCSHSPSVIRTNRVFNQLESNHTLYHIMSSGRYFVAFYGPNKNDVQPHSDHMIDIFDRADGTKLRRLNELHAKPDIFRIVEELGLFFISYPGYIMVEVVKLGREQSEYIDLGKPGVSESGSVCDIVIREYISIRGNLHRRVIMIALNTEPLDNRHFHIGVLQMFPLTETGEVINTPVWNFTFLPVPLAEGRFFNQCIQKKGLSDFSDDHAVVVVGGCEGSAVLGVVDIQGGRVAHKLQLRGTHAVEREGGCEGGACQYSVVSLMIDRVQPTMCAVLLSTGQLNVIHLLSGNTLFHRHLQFDGQLKMAMHQPRLLGSQRIGIKFRNFATFYDLFLSSRASDIKLLHVRTLRITSVDGRETRLDDNPSQELRRQFGELQKRVRALNHYTSGIQKKLDKGLRPGTVTQGVLSMTKKVQLVTSKLDQAHGKAREIEAIVIASIAFDNRFCHALTLNRDLVIFDLLGALETYEVVKRKREGVEKRESVEKKKDVTEKKKRIEMDSDSAGSEPLASTSTSTTTTTRTTRASKFRKKDGDNPNNEQS